MPQPDAGGEIDAPNLRVCDAAQKGTATTDDHASAHSRVTCRCNLNHQADRCKEGFEALSKASSMMLVVA